MKDPAGGVCEEEAEEEGGKTEEERSPRGGCVRGEGEPRAASGDPALPRGRDAGPWGRREPGRAAGSGAGGPVRVAFLACNLPRTFSRPGGEGVCGEGEEASVSLYVLSPIPSIFPLHSGLTCLFPSTGACSVFFFFFQCRHERLFLLLETLLGRGVGVRCCNFCRSCSVFKKGEGTWRTSPAPGRS